MKKLSYGIAQGLLVACFWAFAIGVSAQEAESDDQYYGIADFASVKKYDTHVHINKYDTAFVRQAEQDGFHLLTVNVNTPYYPALEVQQEVALELKHAFPEQVAYATAFDVTGWGKRGWLKKNLAYLEDSFEKGAIAVKIWKNIGMSLQDKKGNFVMVDDPSFEPIIEWIEKHQITLLGHLGEPLNAWLPVEKMTINGDKRYFTAHPEYHMFVHKDYPLYQDQINARNHLLEKHPNLRFVGAHLGSLEWDVDELAKCLDTYPNMAVDMAARISHLQHQSIANREKVRNFMIKYQDRLIYSTDQALMPEADPTSTAQNLHQVWLRDWQFFTSDDPMEVSSVNGKFNGLKLPRQVIDKIYRINAEKWFPGI
ncbi:amidohydrolase family protein [Parapedobacter defluvii]|uniref:amidohydrolase family protein n=1 Tax=Parapedobacter defluvii TaxID=2045106 RepID=UPI00333F28C5